jgi:hypothetical protein
MEISQKAQTKWMESTAMANQQNKYFKLDSIFDDIDNYSRKNSLSRSDYGIINATTNLILAIEAYKRDENVKNVKT